MTVLAWGAGKQLFLGYADGSVGAWQVEPLLRDRDPFVPAEPCRHDSAQASTAPSTPPGQAQVMPAALPVPPPPAASRPVPLPPFQLSGLDHYDSYTAVVADGAGGQVVIGAQNGDTPGESKARILRVGADGSRLAEATFLPEGAVLGGLVDLTRLPGGDVAAAGWLRQAGANANDCWVVRLAPDGGQRWSRTLGGPASHERCYFVEMLANGDLLDGGRTEEDGSGKGKASGAVWQLAPATGAPRPGGQAVYTAKGAERSAFQASGVLPDGGVVLGGWTTNPARGDDDLWIVKLRPDGTPAWEQQTSGPGPDLVTTVLPRPDGGVVVLGHTTKEGAKATSGLAMALRPDGSTAWRRELEVGTGGNEKLERGLLRPNGTLVAVGAASTDAKAPFEGWVVRLDRDGKLLDQRLLDDPPGGRLLGVEEAGGGNVVAVGAAHARDRNGVDGWIVWLPAASPGQAAGQVAAQ